MPPARCAGCNGQNRHWRTDGSTRNRSRIEPPRAEAAPASAWAREAEVLQPGVTARARELAPVQAVASHRAAAPHPAAAARHPLRPPPHRRKERRQRQAAPPTRPHGQPRHGADHRKRRARHTKPCFYPRSAPAERNQDRRRHQCRFPDPPAQERGRATPPPPRGQLRGVACRPGRRRGARAAPSAALDLPNGPSYLTRLRPLPNRWPYARSSSPPTGG